MKQQNNLYWQSKLDLDNEQVLSSCVTANNWVNHNITDCVDPLTDVFHIANVYNSYNLFALPLPGFHQLYSEVCSNIKQVIDSTDYWIKAWVNVYGPDKYHTWHGHKEHTWMDDDSYVAKHNSYHGIVCVNGIDSVTSYKRDNNTVHIPWTENNQFVLIRNSEDWQHRTWPYKHKGNRVTVAMNLFHRQDIDTFRYGSHWLPVI